MAQFKYLSPSDFAETNTLADPHISQDGRYLSYVKKVRGKSYLVWSDVLNPTGKVEIEAEVKSAHTFGGGITQLSQEGLALYFVTISGGISKMDCSSGEIDRIYDGPGVSQISLSANGNRLAGVIFGDRVAVFNTHGDSAPVVISESKRRLRPFSGLGRAADYFVTERPDFVFDVSISSMGDKVVWHEWALPKMPWQRSQIVYADLAGSQRSGRTSDIIVCAGGDYFVCQPRFSPKGDKIAFLAETDSYLRMWISDLDNWIARLIVDEPFEHFGVPWGVGNRSFDFSRDGKRIVFTRNEAGFGRLLEADLENFAINPVAKAHHFGLETSSNSLLAIRSGSTTPHVVVKYDLSGFGRTEIERAFSNKYYEAISVEPILGTAPFSDSLHRYIKPIFLREFSSVPPVAVPYRLFRPGENKDKFFPTIVSFHGGPTDQSLVTYAARNTAFLQAGYQVVTFDYRGSSGWGKEFREGLDGEFGVGEIADLLSLLSHLFDRDLARPNTVVVNGGSSGGYSALRAVSVTKGIFSGAIAEYPLVDLVESAVSTHRFESRYFDHLIGKLPEELARYRVRSVSAQELDDVPILIMQGDKDPVVNYRQVVRFVEESMELGRDVTFKLFENEGHGFSAPEHIEAEFAAYEAFLARVRENIIV